MRLFIGIIGFFDRVRHFSSEKNKPRRLQKRL
jgi:hypothetical protein